MLIEQLSSLTDELAALEPWTLTGAEIRQLTVAVQRARTCLDATMSRLAGSADQMGVPHDDGATSATAWLSNLTGISKGEAAKLVALAKATTDNTEATRAAWASGQISTDQAAVIMKAVNALPDWCGDTERSDAEAHLIALAADYALDDLKRLANRVLEVIDPDGAEQVVGEQLRAEEQRAWDATRMTVKRRGDGTTRGSFVIPDADADILRAAIEGIIAPRRTQANAARHGLGADDWLGLPRDQKMGHAFVELIAHLPTGTLPQAGGLAATVAVTIDIDDLRTGQGTATNTSGTTMSATKAQRLACNAHLVALYLENGTRVIDHGMTRRLYDRHQRLALAVRDGGCVFPGNGGTPAQGASRRGRTGHRPGAKHTTSTSGQKTARPTSTTPRCCATSITSSSTKANGWPGWPPTASSRSSHPHASTPNKNPEDTHASPDNNHAPPRGSSWPVRLTVSRETTRAGDRRATS